MTCSVTAIGRVNRIETRMLVDGGCEILEMQLFIYCKQKLMDHLRVVCLFEVKKYRQFFTVLKGNIYCWQVHC